MYSVGDIVLTGVKSQGFVSRLIKFGAWVGRYPEEARRFCHAALIVSEEGAIAEAVEQGVVFSHIDRFPEGDTVIIPMNVYYENDRDQIRAFAENVVAAHYQYGFFSFAACGLNCILSSLKWRPIVFGVAHTKICSAFVADALTRAGVVWDKPQETIMPADIWVQYGGNAKALVKP